MQKKNLTAEYHEVMNNPTANDEARRQATRKLARHPDIKTEQARLLIAVALTRHIAKESAPEVLAEMSSLIHKINPNTDQLEKFLTQMIKNNKSLEAESLRAAEIEDILAYTKTEIGKPVLKTLFDKFMRCKKNNSDQINLTQQNRFDNAIRQVIARTPDLIPKESQKQATLRRLARQAKINQAKINTDKNPAISPWRKRNNSR